MDKEHIFIVEDEASIQELIRYNLEKEGYHVSCFSDAESMLTKLKETPPDALLLDIMLPGIDGLKACKEVRQSDAHTTTPIIMLTAKGEEEDIVAGLELGADDYIIKPFSPRVLVARLKAVLRRKKERPTVSANASYMISDLRLNLGRHEAIYKETPLILTASEFSALSLLAQNPGWVYTRMQIVKHVHGENYPVTDRSVDVMIASLRKKMGDAGQFIETVRGVGYRFYDEKKNDA